MAIHEKQLYAQAFFRGLGPDAKIVSRHLEKRQRLPTRISLHDVQQSRTITVLDVEHLPPLSNAVMVVDNIDLDTIVALGLAFDLDPAFFVEHAASPGGPFGDPRKVVLGKWSADHRKPRQRWMGWYSPASQQEAGETERRESWHVDGVYEYGREQSKTHEARLSRASNLTDGSVLPRLISCDQSGAWSSTTRISYCLVNSDLYLLLVDVPLIQNPQDLCQPRMRPQLRVPLGLNRGGLMLPPIFTDPQSSLFSSLEQFFSHPWHFHILFAQVQGGSMNLSPDTLFHLLASSTWSANLAILERSIEQIAFQDIQRPTIKINDSLHAQRRDLRLLFSKVSKALKWLPPSVRSELEAAKDKLPAAKYIGFPDVILADLLSKAECLEKFLMDTFQLLLSTIGVIEAESTKEQAKRGQMLTKLAFVYVPLSFVTSIFGMNVREINDSQLSIWVCVVVLAIVGVCTGVIFFGYRFVQKK